MAAKKRTTSKRNPVRRILRVHAADLQIDFWARLQQIRSRYLTDALSQTVTDVDVTDIDRELELHVGNEHLAPLTQQGLRGEVFFPIPLLLRAKPQLLGYYRLLYGCSQKEFYKAPFGVFKAMEERNQLNQRNESLLPALCDSLIETGAKLLTAIQPVSLAAIHELQLLTVGPQFRGSQNVAIGKGATRQVFDLIRSLVSAYILTSTESVISVRNAAGRSVQIAFAADPDITIIERMPTTSVPSTSIEIKGGSDVSNVHNRIGEAEKSHLNARESGFTRFWTILKAHVSEDVAKAESPTTTAFFNLAEILDENTAQYTRFKELLHQTVGIG
jgi:hypothetical protein